MLLNTAPSAAMRELPLQFFESIIEIGAEDQQKMLFVDSGYTLATEEAERIGALDLRPPPCYTAKDAYTHTHTHTKSQCTTCAACACALCLFFWQAGRPYMNTLHKHSASERGPEHGSDIRRHTVWRVAWVWFVFFGLGFTCRDRPRCQG